MTAGVDPFSSFRIERKSVMRDRGVPGSLPAYCFVGCISLEFIHSCLSSQLVQFCLFVGVHDSCSPPFHVTPYVHVLLSFDRSKRPSFLFHCRVGLLCFFFLSFVLTDASLRPLRFCFPPPLLSGGGEGKGVPFCIHQFLLTSFFVRKT